MQGTNVIFINLKLNIDKLETQEQKAWQEFMNLINRALKPGTKPENIGIFPTMIFLTIYSYLTLFQTQANVVDYQNFNTKLGV